MNDVQLFSTWLPVSIIKGDDAKRVKIGGIISTDTVDQQGDMIKQDGMDFSYFLDKGYFNYEHQQGINNILGVPTKVEQVDVNGKKGTRVEGYLMTEKKLAQDVLDTITAIEKAEIDRKIGFSVEGQVLARDKNNPKIITKAKILNVAITSAPVNPDATLEVLARSLNKANDLESKARAILEKVPELYDSDVMKEIHVLIAKKYNESKKSMVGYAEPAKADENASLSALQEQSIDDEKSAYDDMQKMMYDRLRDEMQKMLKEQMDMLLNQSEKAITPNITTKQLKDAMLRVFPNISEAQARKIALNLVTTAKNRYNND